MKIWRRIIDRTRKAPRFRKSSLDTAGRNFRQWVRRTKSSGILGAMPIDVPLDQMSFPEKLQLMEILWDNLTRHPADFPSPDWHKDVLEECRRRAESGEEKFTDWATAKEEIRQRIR